MRLLGSNSDTLALLDSLTYCLSHDNEGMCLRFRGKQGDNNAQRMEDEDFKDEKPEENPLGDVIEGTTHQKAQKGEVDEEEGAVQKDGNGATGTNDQAQGSSKKALPSYQRLDKNFLKATLPKIVKLSRTEIAQDLRVWPRRTFLFSFKSYDTICQLSRALLNALARHCR